MDILTSVFLGQPLWMWLGFFGLVVALLAFDLGILHRDGHEIEVRESLLLSGFYIALGLAFGGFVWWQLGAQSGVEYLTGFVVEKSLAMDNVFVIAMIFGYLAIPRPCCTALPPRDRRPRTPRFRELPTARRAPPCAPACD